MRHTQLYVQVHQLVEAARVFADNASVPSTQSSNPAPGSPTARTTNGVGLLPPVQWLGDLVRIPLGMLTRVSAVLGVAAMG